MSKNRTLTSIAGIVLLRPTSATSGRQLECLVAQKVRGDNAGKWVFPNGGVNFEEPLEAALKRETVDETGLIVMPIHATPYYYQRQVDDGIPGSPHKLFVLVTPVTGSPVNANPPSKELTDGNWRSVGYILTTFASLMAPAYLKALQHFDDSGVLDLLALRDEWTPTPVDKPVKLPAEALQRATPATSSRRRFLRLGAPAVC